MRRNYYTNIKVLENISYKKGKEYILNPAYNFVLSHKDWTDFIFMNTSKLYMYDNGTIKELTEDVEVANSLHYSTNEWMLVHPTKDAEEIIRQHFYKK